ncbi:MAG TPA: helicase-exonuclease AddAB subunit AddB [Candidatus Eisenbergiella merdipullorum]|uniref:Helicase-exonuclease AddAB subunit AddB n=1 Tax=Candidatus Eisenbergiella merdipullorum TaxID=2838553 RepID=A0A9D2I6X6_9FIRM|nr:helicase-exonuclease AddAB subunit AddB [Candidatus Eisenbergiella merdipullorum]
MSLRFYIGASGAGKSTALYREIIERSMKRPEQNFFLIVPDQFSMQTQAELVRLHPRKGIMNIDVLSFSRLAHRVFEEVGEDARTVLDDTGKSLVIRRIAGSLKEKTTVIGPSLNKTGYVHEVKSVLSEFMQYGIGPRELEELTEYASGRGGLYHKLKDLGVLYQGFREYMEKGYVTAEETLGLLAERLPQSQLARGAVVALDGFIDFTPVQKRVLRALMELAQEVIVTVLADGQESFEDAGEEENLFHLSRKTMVSLTKIAAEAGIARGKDVIFSERPVYRLKGNAPLSWMEQHLLRYPLRPYPGKDAQRRVTLFEASSQREEVRQVCIAIREYLRRTGGCYRDVAVIAGDLTAYASDLETFAALYDIPLYLDRTRGIVLNPFIEYMKSALQIIARNFTYETVFHYLRSGLADFTRDEVDVLENYVLACGIRGKKKWSDIFTARTQEMEDAVEKLERLNGVRERLMRQLSPLMGHFTKVEELVRALYAFVEENGVQRKLKEYEDRFRQEQDAVRAMEYLQIYRLVMDLLDQVVELIGDEPVKIEEFYQILEAGLSEIQVGTIPQNVDRVVAGDMERTRLTRMKAVFFIGVNDGYIPKAAENGGLLSDVDREFLLGSGMELAPTPRQQMYMQRLYLYMNMTKPSDHLFLSYARMNGEGKAMRPSYLISMVKKLFPQLSVLRPEEEAEIDQVQSLKDGRAWLVQGLRRYADGRLAQGSGEEEQFGKLFRVYAISSQTAQWTKDMARAAFYAYEEQPLGKAAALALFGSTLLGSVSRLEQYASCAYAHFLQYGLYLKEREDYSFEAVDMGNLFHGVLEIFGEKLKEKGYTWFDFPKETGDTLVEEAVEAFAASYGSAVLYDSARNRYLIDRMKRILKRTVSTLQYQLKKGAFSPEHFEVSFSVLEDLDAVNIALTGEEKLRLRGRIDRVDTWREPAWESPSGKDRIYVKVIDYKSGSRDFSLAALYYGLQLQLVVYLNAAVELEQKVHPGDEVVPAAMLYYRVHDPIVEVEEKPGEEEEEIVQRVQKELLGRLRMTGAVNSEDAVIEGLDAHFTGRSDVIPVERKKDGELTARSSVLSGEEFRVISDYVNLKIREIGTEILDGRIPLNPYRQAGGSAGACTYCPYSRVCGFDRRIPGYEGRTLEKLEEKEAMRRMKEALQQAQQVSGQSE